MALTRAARFAIPWGGIRDRTQGRRLVRVSWYALSAFSTMMLKLVLPVITLRLEAQLCTHQL